MITDFGAKAFWMDAVAFTARAQDASVTFLRLLPNFIVSVLADPSCACHAALHITDLASDMTQDHCLEATVPTGRANSEFSPHSSA